MKTMYTKLAHRTEPVSYSTHSISSMKNHNVNRDISINVVELTSTSDVNTFPSRLFYPTFTITIVILDLFMLLFVYIVQQETTITSETWIKMGAKYVPCMRPIYSTMEEEVYQTHLKKQCQSFLFPYQLFRFITPIFLHGGITHLISNLVYQALAEFLLEGRYSIKKLSFCYLLFGFSGNMMSALCNPKTSMWLYNAFWS